jgi:ABC-type phosphate/phosphonate transport system substrate-binding protein
VLVAPGWPADPSWPKELTFSIMATASAAEVMRRWGPILAQLETDLGVKVKPVVADFRGIVGVLKSGNADFGHLMKKWIIENPSTTTVYSDTVLQGIREVIGKQ